MNKSFIFVAISSLLGMAAIYFGSTVADLYAAKPDANFGNNPTQSCVNEPESLSAECCWDETGEEGIELTYCQYCFINTDTGEFENCSNVKQYRGLPNSTVIQEPEGLKDDGTTTPQKPKFPGAMTGLDAELLAPTNDTNKTNVKKGLSGLNDLRGMKEEATVEASNETTSARIIDPYSRYCMEGTGGATGRPCLPCDPGLTFEVGCIDTITGGPLDMPDTATSESRKNITKGQFLNPDVPELNPNKK